VQVSAASYDLNRLSNGFTNSLHCYGSGMYNGSSYYPRLTLKLDMPNKSGSNYIKGEVTLICINDMTASTMLISNRLNEHQELTWTGLKSGKSYIFYYKIEAVGSSKKGYIGAYVD